MNRSCKTRWVSYGLLIGIILLSTLLPVVQSYVPNSIPTDNSKIFYYRYHVTQNVASSSGQTKTSEFDEVYRIQFLDDQKINYTAILDITFYTSCTGFYTKNWNFESRAEYDTRLINQTLTYQDNMNYLNTHIRLYAPPGIAIGANILSNNIELGYRWGISTIKDLTMTRGANALYFIGLNTYDVIPFSGSDAQVLTGWVVDSYSMQVTDYYDSQSLIWLGSDTVIHDYKAGSDPLVWVDHTISRQLKDIDYVGEDPHEDDFDNVTPYDIWKDPMLWVAVSVVGGIVIGMGAFIHVVRKRAREWQLAEIEKFEADQAAQSKSQQDEEST